MLTLDVTQYNAAAITIALTMRAARVVHVLKFVREHVVALTLTVLLEGTLHHVNVMLEHTVTHGLDVAEPNALQTMIALLGLHVLVKLAKTHVSGLVHKVPFVLLYVIRQPVSAQEEPKVTRRSNVDQ